VGKGSGGILHSYPAVCRAAQRVLLNRIIYPIFM
jgi:hypothetical protein